MTKLPNVTNAARAMQLASAASIKGTPAAKLRAQTAGLIGGKSIAPAAARARALKAWETKRAKAKQKVSTPVSTAKQHLQKQPAQRLPKR